MGLFRKSDKNNDFYSLIYQHSEKMLEGVGKLKAYMEDGSVETGNEVIRCEREGDELRKILIDELNKTFITPIEREDLYNLSKSIDDMLDYSRSTFEEMQLFELKPTQELKDMLNLLYDAAENINYAIKYLKNNPALSTQHSVYAKQVENKIEAQYRINLCNLFKMKDMEYVLKMREIFRHLSNLADKTDYTGDVICHIVVKIV